MCQLSAALLQHIEGSDILEKAFTWDGQTAGASRLPQFENLQDYRAFKRKTYVEAFGPAHMPEAYPTIERIFRSHMEAAAACDHGVKLTEVLQDATLQARLHNNSMYCARGGHFTVGLNSHCRHPALTASDHRTQGRFALAR